MHIIFNKLFPVQVLSCLLSSLPACFLYLELLKVTLDLLTSNFPINFRSGSYFQISFGEWGRCVGVSALVLWLSETVVFVFRVTHNIQVGFLCFKIYGWQEDNDPSSGAPYKKFVYIIMPPWRFLIILL
jgi:hypothetical protein